MSTASDAIVRLQELAELRTATAVPLAPYTRFGIGGQARLFCETAGIETFHAALGCVQESGMRHVVIGGGSNLIVADEGFDGAVLRFTGEHLAGTRNRLRIQAGLPLQTLVDQSIALGFSGIETMTGIPGTVGGAIYGNAGAYGRSVNECVESVTYTDGEHVCMLSNEKCEFNYRESIFKRRKDWVILYAMLSFGEGDPVLMKRKADEIRAIRDEKYPPSMKCAGSIFKNCFFAKLPPHVQSLIPDKVVREGKVPSAWFLEQVGAKGLRVGDIQVASYHANLIYNDGEGKSADVVRIITDLKQRVRDTFGFNIEEEVQYIGF
ncbi:MAG TPA: UDP-N-acetylmuramate dehydrogenase [Bryobacteraceae bacterium]|nr:UDP-N-acetylmuramate dehydrogenase [Bryobacteraceae bacterium]